MTFAQPFQDYEILDRVGAGAMGTVFKARHKRLNRIVALKVLKPSLARDNRYVDRLRREARIVASLSHPNIVTGYDLGEEAGYHFFVMEFVEGKSLRGMLAEWGMFAEEHVARIARQVAQALDHAWQRGVIHRDIKPGNILIDEAGAVKLTDMGLAKGPADLTLTRDGATVGTPQYISPEQARNPHDVDVRTDLYSLGATLYHMATGVPPFRGDTMAELITSVLHDLPVSPKAINSALSEGMSLVIRKLLAKDLTVRYQTPRDLLDDLDRLDRAQPPQIDVTRLSEDAGETGRWWPRVLLAVGVAVLLGGAWLLGIAMQDRPDAQPTASEFLTQLAAELDALPSPGAKQMRLNTITSIPAGSERDVMLLRQKADAEMQEAVNRAVNSFVGDGFTTLAAWLRDPAVWPDRARAERERLQPRLLAEVGLSPAQLPSYVRTQSLDELRHRIDGVIADRDAQLIERFSLHLKTRVPALAEERLRASDFAGAERTWRDALVSFADGVRMPLPERLAETTYAALKELALSAHKEADVGISAAEREVETALRAEVAAVCTNLTERLATSSPTAVDAELRQFRQALEHDWPPASSFRAGRNPWPDLERQFGVLAVEIGGAIARREEQRFQNRCDYVWRVFCHGSADDAAARLSDIAEPGTARASQAERHRIALAAASAVEAAILQSMRHQPTVAFLRQGGEALEIRVESVGEQWRLVGNTINQQPRAVRLGELRFSQLLARLQQDRDPLAALAPAERALGVAVFRLLGDDLAGISSLLAAIDPAQRQFLDDEIWPRILRVRGETPEMPLDRGTLFTRLREAREAAAKTGGLGELEQALFAAASHVPEAERSSVESAELQRVTTWLRLERRRQALTAELVGAAPAGVTVGVHIAGEELHVEVAFGAATLQREAMDGWQLHGDVLEFADGGRPWTDQGKQTLRGNPGLDAAVLRTTLQVDFVLPAASVGRRFWVFEFRGVAVLLVLGADDTVHAALIDGELRHEDNLQRAFLRTMAAMLAPTKVVAVPGGVHRLTIELALTGSRAHAAVRVLFEGHEIAAQKVRKIDPERPPSFAVHPQQDLAVHRVVVRGEGL